MKSKLSEAEQFVLLHGYIQGSVPQFKRTTSLDGSKAEGAFKRGGSSSPSRARASVRASRRTSPTGSPTTSRGAKPIMKRAGSSSNQSAENLALSCLSWHSSSTNDVGKRGAGAGAKAARPTLERNATWGASSSGTTGQSRSSTRSSSTSYSKSSRSTMAAARGRSFRRSMSPASDGLPASSNHSTGSRRSPSTSDHKQRLSERLEARAHAKRGRSPTTTEDALTGDSGHGSVGSAKLAPNPKDVPFLNGTAASRSPSPHCDSARNYRLSVVGLRERHSSRRLTTTSPNSRRSVSPIRASTGNAMAATRRSVSPLRRSQSPLRRSQSPNKDDRRRSQSPCRRSTSAMRNSQLQLLDDSELDKQTSLRSLYANELEPKETKTEEEEEEDEVDAYFQVKWLDSKASITNQEEEPPSLKEEGDNVEKKNQRLSH